VRLFLSQGDGMPENNSLIYFKVDDIRSAQDELKEKGIEFTHAAHRVHTHEDGTEEWMAFMIDPDGQPIGLMGIY
jgi:predicted enzyme related to lactoylglutathione lyase